MDLARSSYDYLKTLIRLLRLKKGHEKEILCMLDSDLQGISDIYLRDNFLASDFNLKI